MNCLNSIILEGKITDSLTLARCTIITVDSTRNSKDDDGKAIVEHTVVDVVLNESPSKILQKHTDHKGLNVRVVGRLATRTWENARGTQESALLIIGEHIEVKSL